MSEEIMVLFTSGEYSDFGLSGLKWVRVNEYELTKHECSRLEEKETAIKTELRNRDRAGTITRKEIEALLMEHTASKEQRYTLWLKLLNSGRAVDYVELWHGDA